MITRPPLHYESPAQTVRMWRLGLPVPDVVYLYALSQLPVEPPVVYRTVDEDDVFADNGDSYGQWSLDLAHVMNIRREWGGL